jgi:hypothetical protein
MRRYRQFDHLNSFDQRLRASLRRRATKRITWSVQNSFVDVPTTDDVELNGVPFLRSGVQMNSFGAALEARLSRFNDLNVRYENTWIDFDEKDNFLTGGTVNGLLIELGRRLSERSRLGAEYAFRIADLHEAAREVTFQDAGATFRHTWTPHTSLSLAGGVSRLHERVTGETHTGPYIRSAITREGERVTMGASVERRFVPSFGFGSNKSQELRGFVQMPLSRNRSYVHASATWRKNDPFIEGGVRLDSVWIRSAVGYAVARWLRTELFYGYTRQDSEITGGEIWRHRVGAQAVVSQPIRIH